MPLPPAATLPQATHDRRVMIVTAGVLLAIILAFGDWIRLRHARVNAEREKQALAAEKAAASAGTASENDAAARAIANYLARTEAQLHAHGAAFQRLQKAQVFTWTIRKRGDIEFSRQMLQAFLATNARLTDSEQYAADLIRAEFNTAQVPPRVRDSALALFEKSQAELLPLQMHVRHCDQALGESALAVLDFLDLNWGSWRRDETSGRLEFNNSILMGSFKDYAESTKAAAIAQQAAQEELVAYQKRHPKP